MDELDFPVFNEEYENEEIITFFYEEVGDDIIDEERTAAWISDLIHNEKKNPGAITYIFCTDEYLLEINEKFLDHDTLTDIITFQYRTDPLEGDIYISVERTRDNAGSMGIQEDVELRRVIAHGVLHLCGYKDKSPQEEKEMREKEEFYLDLY